MYIQEIIIDGFKSYAQKTVVSGFDPQFNAITGLNGTGKSNILDAICFVLGISNLSQVRVGNLQELVYKQGQAGVTKASVTIIFNNADAATSPVGYEAHKQITVTRQVVIGGKNKYMVNGHTVQQSQVANLFHSVQLNVNNPHFLIMQGRITKVLNMKPPEILSMIEEAAGTRMFETKKQASIKTIEKKQLKVDEITKCIDEEITPTLENLRTERAIYHEWQANNAECEQTERLCVAAEYSLAAEKVLSAEQDKARLEEEERGFLATEQAKQGEAEECAMRVRAIVQRRDQDMEGEMRVLKKKENELSKDVVKQNSLLQNHEESVQSEKETLSILAKQLKTLEVSLVQRERDLANAEQELTQKETISAEKEREYQSLREKLHNAAAGVANEDTAALLSLPEQILAWEKVQRETASKLQTTDERRRHRESELAALKRKNVTQSASTQTLQREIDTLRATIRERENQLSLSSSSSAASASSAQAQEQEQALRRERISVLQRETQTMRDALESKSARLDAQLRFDFADPERGFDRSRVKGLVARLFSLRDRETATALEVVAGGKLSHVVVDNEKTGALLLQKGGLRQRVTLLPLNKITHRVLAREKVERAREVARRMKGTATLALDLIVFDESVRNAMEHVFGTVIVCSTSEIARAIAFDDALRVKTVTLEGDSFDPAGTLTGGSTSSLSTLIADLHDVRTMREQTLRAKDEELTREKALFRETETALAKVRELASSLEIMREELRGKEDRLAQSDYSRLQSEIAEMEKEIQSIAEECKQHKELNTKAKAELLALSKTEKSASKAREQKLKEFEDEVKAAQKASSAARSAALAAKARRDAVKAELDALLKEREAAREQKTISEGAMEKLKTEGKALESKLQAVREEYDRAKAAVQEKTAELNRASKEIQVLESQRDQLLKEANNASLEARKISHKLKQWEKDFKDASRAMQALAKQHPWIEKEKAFFGKAGTDFDFSAKDVAKCAKRLKTLKADQERLSKKINKKVMGMIENAEAEYQDLTHKRETILRDKAKIESVIEELDDKKKQALHKTWQQVNRDFGSIFSMLLPGTTAKLEPPEDCEVSEGLEVKVAFNGVWKESLTELSGGQRSLLALSLILALLLFKPAPMYILDEVDAALDLSHTQNIGMMIRTHFSASQFIVVSLKEGMFNNANVIFRTRFVDGISAVTRTVAGARAKNGAASASTGGGAAGLIAATAAAATTATFEEDEDEEDLASAPAKKKGKASARSKTSLA